MSLSLQEIDPDWAWSPLEPNDPSRPWDRRLAAHLFRRAGFGATAEQLRQAVTSDPLSLVQQMIAGAADTTAFDASMQRMATTLLAGGDPRKIGAWWIYRMLHTPNQLQEKLTLFWHGHFATSAAKVEDARLMLEQNQLLRQYALGDFAALVQAVSRDPAMLIYLDSVTNRKTHPNENYARELMELFCLGEGNYSEQDIRELARCFTGWEIKRQKFRFNRYQHDFGTKTILGKTGKLTGEDGVRIVLQQPAAADFIARKLVRFFVMDEPHPSDELIQPLAQQFRADDLQIAPLVQRILTSNLFFSEHAIGRKVRSPIEMAIGMLRTLEATTDTNRLAARLNQLGHGVLYPPNVKGWDGGRTWINSSTLLGRANLIRDVLVHENSRFGGGDLNELLAKHQIDSPETLVDWLEETFLAVPLPNTVRRGLVELASGNGGESSERYSRLIHAVSALPEFHIG